MCGCLGRGWRMWEVSSHCEPWCRWRRPACFDGLSCSYMRTTRWVLHWVNEGLWARGIHGVRTGHLPRLVVVGKLKL